MTAVLKGLIATDASFEAVAEEAIQQGYQLSIKQNTLPKNGSLFVASSGNIERVRFRCLGWVISTDLRARHSFYRWRTDQNVGALILEPERSEALIVLHWVAIFLITLSRCLLVLLTSVLASVPNQPITPLWIVMALILGAVTYTSITLIHRAQWSGLIDALDAMAPDWIPRLSPYVGSTALSFITVVVIFSLYKIFNLRLEIWLIVIAFLLIDLAPTRHFRQAKSLVLNPKIFVERSPRRMMRRLRILFSTKAHGVHVISTETPETLLRASEQLVREGVPISVLGPDAEFLPGTLRKNFAWDWSDSADFHFENLMILIGFDEWRERFGSLDYQIGTSNAGLSSYEAAILQIARAMAQGSETLVLVDALAPLSADRQFELIERLNRSECRFFVYSSVADLWGIDIHDID